MNQQRRDALRISTVVGLAVAVGLLRPLEALADDWNKAAFDAKNLNDAVKALGGVTPVVSRDVLINVPDIADNGAMVQVGVATTLPNVQQIAILIEKNPSALAGNFTIPAGTEAAVSTRVKMVQTSNVHALVKSDGKWLMATKEIKVTIGDCGA